VPRVLVLDGDRATVVQASSFSQERDLHDLVRDHPELIPTADLFGEDFIPYVVGYEVRLGGKYADLVLTDSAGNLAVVEFKLERNEDMRQVFAQVVEYAAQLWGMPYEQFEEQIVRRYFNSEECRKPELRGKSLVEGIRALFDPTEDGWEERFRERVSTCLYTGDLRLILVADHLDEVTQRSVEYVRAHGLTNLHTVEVRHFQEAGLHVLVPTAITSRYVASSGGQSAARANRPSTAYGPWNEEGLAQCLDLIADNGLITDDDRREFAAFVQEFGNLASRLAEQGLATADFRPYSAEANNIFASIGLRLPSLGNRGVVRCACYAGDKAEGATGVNLLWQVPGLRRATEGDSAAAARIDRLVAAVRDAIASPQGKKELIARIERSGEPWTPLRWFGPSGRQALLEAVEMFFRDMAS